MYQVMYVSSNVTNLDSTMILTLLVRSKYKKLTVLVTKDCLIFVEIS